ncbi:MAG TPA: TonB-dependent receptor [Verrucomicrobiales bacterium]|jgi:iron complex outermembrane receptor protein|nr:TonB-dependent receptor [Verrucomicrobiales bacterium]
MKVFFLPLVRGGAKCGLLAAMLLLPSHPLVAQDNGAPANTLPALVVSSEPSPPPAVPERPVPPPTPRTIPQPAPEPPLLIDDLAPQPISLTVPSVEEARAELMLLPGGTAIIDAEDYKRGRATNLKDALDYAPGVFVQPRFGSEESRLSIRGSGIQRTFHGRGLKLMQDGVPLNLADGGFDFQAIEPLAAQYIEVFRGANALEYGGTTLGGAINFVSHTGHTGSPLQARFEYGSFDSFRGQISSAIVDGDQDAYVSFTQSSSDGFRDHSEQSNQRFFANLGYVISPELETRFYLTYAKTSSELPGEITKAQMLANPTQAARVPTFLRGIQPVARFDHITSDWRRDFELFRLGNKTTWESGDETITVGSFWSNKDLDHPILFVIDQVSNDFGLDVRYDNRADLFGKENHFTLGFAPTYGITEDARFANNFGTRGAIFADSHQTSLNTDLYVQNSHYFVPDVALVTGAQLSYAERKNRDDFPIGPNNSDSQDWAAFSPKLGLLWDVAPKTQVFTNVSRSFEPPSFGELVDANNGGAGLIQLNEQTATTFELGTRGYGDKVSWDLAYYHSLVDDELLSYQVQPGLTQTVNAGNTIHQGIEAALDIELFSGLFAKGSSSAHAAGGKSIADKVPLEPREDKVVFRQNYLWNDFQFDDDATFGDNHLAGIPQHYYRAELLYEHPSGIYAGPNLEWVPEAYNVDSAATEFADAYALLGFKVGYRSERGFSIFVEAKNLTDEIYSATTSVVDASPAGGGALFLPGDGRSIYAGIEWKW